MKESMLTLLCQLPLHGIEQIVITHVLKFILTLCYDNMSNSIAGIEKELEEGGGGMCRQEERGSKRQEDLRRVV